MKAYHPRPEQYYVVKATSLFDLMATVNKKIQEHWTPFGGMVVKDDDYMQPMVYWELSEEDKKPSPETRRAVAKMAEGMSKLPLEARRKVGSSSQEAD